MFVAVLVPVYIRHYGPGNFLWFSDVALFLGLAAVWLEHPLLASTQAIAVAVPEALWNLDFFLRLLTGVRLGGMTDYMFDPSIPLSVRALSLFHVWLPVVLISIVVRLGYDSRALPLQFALGSMTLVASYLLTEPDRNVNLVHRWGSLHAPWSLALSLSVFPLAFYAPAHLLLRTLCPKPRAD